MDESEARLVHGRSQQQRDLETAVYRDRAQHAPFRRIQSARIHYMFAFVFDDRRAVYGSSEIDH